MDADLRAWGATDEDRARVAGPEQDRDFEVWDENWAAVSLFCAASSQWRVRPDNRLMGLDYNAVDVTARRLEMEVTRDDWAKMMVMEKEVLEALKDG